MPDKPAHPLCDTYGIRDQAKQGAYIMGLLKVSGGVAVVVIGIVFTMIMDTRAEMEKIRMHSEERCAELAAENQRRDYEISQNFLTVTTEIANDTNDVVKVLNVISINQKRVLEVLSLDPRENDPQLCIAARGQLANALAAPGDKRAL